MSFPKITLPITTKQHCCFYILSMEETTNWERQISICHWLEKFPISPLVPNLNTTNAPWILKIRVQPMLSGHSGHHLPQGWECSKNQHWYRKLLHYCPFPVHCSLGPRDEGIPREIEVQWDHSVQQHSTERKVRKNMKKKAYLISAELPEPQWLPWGKKRDGEIMSISSIICVTFIFTVFWARLPRWSKLTAYDGLWQNCNVLPQQRIQLLQLTQLF